MVSYKPNKRIDFKQSKREPKKGWRVSAIRP